MRNTTTKQLLAVVIRAIPYLIILPLLVTLLAGAYYYIYAENEYTASAKLYVLIDYRDSTGNMRYDVTASAQFAGDYQQLLKTHEVTAAAAQKLGRDSLSGLRVSVSAVSNTRVLDLRVTGSDPLLATEAANAIGEAFVEYMTTITGTSSITIASTATTPTAPSGPNRVRNTALAFITTFALCLLFILARELLNNTLRTADDVTDALGLPVMAVVDDFTKEMDLFFKKNPSHKLLIDFIPPDTLESIKMLALNIKFAATSKPIRRVMVTSATAHEGKSSLLIMLAEVLRQEGSRVLLIDLDFRRPSLGRYLSRRNTIDLVDYINSGGALMDVIQATDYEGIDFIDSHHPSAIATNIIQAPLFSALLDSMEAYYDYILVDTPPLGIFVDAAALAPLMDGTLLVLAAGKAERGNVQHVVSQLRTAKANILGAALTFVKRRGNADRYYTYSYTKRGFK